MIDEARNETIDTRWVFRAYAVLAGVTGLVLFGWGPMWLGTDLAADPLGKAALIRVFGSILIAAAFCAAPFALHGPPTPRRGLYWLAGAHLAVFFTLLLQQRAIWGHGLGEKAMQIVGVTAFILLIVYMHGDAEMDFTPGMLTSLFGSDGPRAVPQLRSQYERQIRAAARQEERNRLARDLHDSIKQQVFVIQTAAATAQARFDSDQAGTKQALDQIRDSAREAMTEMQVMLDQLRAVPLENSGLIESLKKQCDALGFRTGARVEFTLGDLPASEAFSPGAHEAILRVAQEALANIGRHARATDVQVSLGSVYGKVELKIKDNGAGFDQNRGARGLGIGNMRARADEFGGTFELTSQLGGGTSVVFSVPYAIGPTRGQARITAAWLAVLAVAAIPLLTFWRGSLGLSIAWMVALVGLIRFIAATVTASRRARARNESAQ